jgi:two-component system, NarL family, sensor histidine kinase UhpB
MHDTLPRISSPAAAIGDDGSILAAGLLRLPTVSVDGRSRRFGRPWGALPISAKTGGGEHHRGMSLVWRVFLVNASVVVVAALVLALSPATVSERVSGGQTVVLVAGVAVVLGVNLVLTRRVFAPLRRLTELMHAVDPMRPGRRVDVNAGVPEVVELADAFNAMLGRLEDERRASGRRAIAAQEAERRRLSRELHDEVAQALTGVVLQLQSAEPAADEALRERLAEAQEAAREGADAVREIVRGLRPEGLDDLGLRSALVTLASTFADRSRVRVRRAIAERLPRLAPEDELVVYRVAQESLTNVARHADARAVEFVARGADGVFELVVRDDGRGIRAGATGTGIEGMRERALLAGGGLEIRRVEPAGTEVRLLVPTREVR